MSKEINFPDGSSVNLVENKPEPGEIDAEVVEAVRIVVRNFPGAKTVGSLKTMI